jgi:hypothetical protein
VYYSQNGSRGSDEKATPEPGIEVVDVIDDSTSSVQRFDKRDYVASDLHLEIEHFLSFSEKEGRKETFFVVNNGDAKAEFAIVQVIPREIYENNYEVKNSVLLFADAEEGDVVVK